MKKLSLYISALLIAGFMLTGCEDPYSSQTVASATSYAQSALQDVNFTTEVSSGVSPLTITSSQLSSDLALLKCTSLPTLLDSTASITYTLFISNSSDFASYKQLTSKFTGKVNDAVSVNYREFNDSVKTYNKNAVQRTVYLRLIAGVTRYGLKTYIASVPTSLLVTPNSYAPVLLNDVVSLAMGTSATIDVLSNDTDPEGDALTITSVSTPSKGTATIVSGKILYTSTATQATSDNFSYTVSDGNGNSVTANVDVTVLAVAPYTAITPRPYYIIGMANGGWNNSSAGLGVSIYPLSVVVGNKYNTAGDGEYTFTGYFWASRGFKLIRDLGNWDEQWGIKNGVFVHNDGGSSDIKVAADGYYTITLNSISNTMTMTAASATPTSYTKIGLIGGFNSWGGDLEMSPCESTNNHMWYVTTTFASDTELKFRADGAWTVNWGSKQFPVGIGTNGGDNIPVKAGTYTILFNDITGTYYFK